MKQSFPCGLAAKCKKSQRGFSLLEVIIVVGITALLASFMLTFSSTGREQIALSVEANKVSQFILRAKSLAVSTYDQPDRPCGYGVNVDYAAKRYVLFIYAPPDCEDMEEIIPDYVRVLDRFSFDTNLVVRENPDSLVAVLFVPPAPSVLIEVGARPGFSNESAKVYLQTLDGSAGLPVWVSLAGQVTF